MVHQVLHPEMSLATVRTYIWKKPEDLILNYKVVQGKVRDDILKVVHCFNAFCSCYGPCYLSKFSFSYFEIYFSGILTFLVGDV